MLRPTFLGFETAKRALTSSQLGLDTVGHNIANVNTPGFTRQRVDQVSFNLRSSQAKYVAYGVQFPGQGAEVQAITQVRDPYLDRRYRTEASKTGELSVTGDGLAKINSIFDEIQTTGSHAKMSELLTQLDELIATADSKEQATVLRNKVQQLTQVLNKNSVDLENAATQQKEEMQNTLYTMNSLLEQIAELNVKIKEDNFYGNPSNELNDTRNLLIDQLSEIVDIDIHHTPIKITEDLSIEQISITIKGSNPPITLVDSGSYNKIVAKYGEDNNDDYTYLDKVSYHLVDGMTGFPVKAIPIIDPATGGIAGYSDDITGTIFTGGLKGHLDIMNGVGIYAVNSGDNSFRGIPYTQQALDEFARKLADTMNALNRQEVIVNGASAYIGRPLIESIDVNATPNVSDFALNGKFTLIDGSVLVDSNGDTVNPDDVTFDTNDPPRLIDKNTGVPIMYQSGNASNYVTTAYLERTITARNISISGSWADNPMYIDNTAKNDALYTVNGTLQIRNDDGTLTSTGIYHGDVKGVDSEGYLLGALGERLKDPSGNDVNIDQLQRAMTENGYKDDSNKIYLNDGTLLEDGSGNEVKADEVEWDNGELVYNGNGSEPAGTPVTHPTTGAPLTADDLRTSIPPADYSRGEQTPNHMLPGSSANDLLLALKIALTDKNTQFPNGFKGTFQEYLVSFQSDMALDSELNDNLLEATLTVMGGLANSRDAVSAVSVDEEAINMITFQNYYNAAARFMTVLDEALGTIIQGMGVVGR